MHELSWAEHTVDQSDNSLVKQEIDHVSSVDHSADHSVDHSVDHSMDLKVNHKDDQSVNHKDDQSVSSKDDQSVNHKDDQSVNRKDDKSVSQSIPHRGDRSVRKWQKTPFKGWLQARMTREDYESWRNIAY